MKFLLIYVSGIARAFITAIRGSIELDRSYGNIRKLRRNKRGIRYKAFSKATIRALVPSLAVGLITLYTLWSCNSISVLRCATLFFSVAALLFGFIAALGPNSNTILFFAGKTSNPLEGETTVRFFLVLFVVLTTFVIFYQLVFSYFE